MARQWPSPQRFGGPREATEALGRTSCSESEVPVRPDTPAAGGTLGALGERGFSVPVLHLHAISRDLRSIARAALLPALCGCADALRPVAADVRAADPEPELVGAPFT